jgi:hypothetical protein
MRSLVVHLGEGGGVTRTPEGKFQRPGDPPTGAEAGSDDVSAFGKASASIARRGRDRHGDAAKEGVLDS